jgi:hypothetical protein
MPGHARKDIVREGEIGVYHTWSRCVQRAFLYGQDPDTGRDFSYRRPIVQALLEYQASVFAVDVGNYSILSNHQHLIARTRPDIAATWSDEEVAWRWKLAWPKWENDRWLRTPTDEEIEEVLADPDRLPVLRANLASLSWFMARWKEPIARLCNAEMQTKGHFYEQRFGSREFVDDAGNLCGNVYVDLNQLKAGMAPTLEACTCSAIYNRLVAWQQEQVEASLEHFRERVPEGYELDRGDMARLLADCFLAPIGNQGPSLLATNAVQFSDSGPVRILWVPKESFHETGEDNAAFNEREESASVTESGLDESDPRASEPPSPESADSAEAPPRPSRREPDDGSPVKRQTKGERPKPTWETHRRLQRRRRRRASDHVFLGIPREQYLGLVQWTASQLSTMETRPPPEDIAGLLRQWGLEPTRWCSVIENFGDVFYRAVGHADRVLQAAQRTGQSWLQGIRTCRTAFS